MVTCSFPVWDEILCLGAHPGSWTVGYRLSFLGVERPGSAVDNPPPSSAEVKERIELYLYSSSRQILCSLRVWSLVGVSGICQNIRPWPPQHFCRQTVGNTKQAIQSLSAQVTKLVIRVCTRVTKRYSNECLVCEYTLCISVRGLRKFHFNVSSVCSWTTLTFPASVTVTAQCRS